MCLLNCPGKEDFFEDEAEQDQCLVCEARAECECQGCEKGRRDGAEVHVRHGTADGEGEGENGGQRVESPGLEGTRLYGVVEAGER